MERTASGLIVVPAAGTETTKETRATTLGTVKICISAFLHLLELQGGQDSFQITSLFSPCSQFVNLHLEPRP